MNPVIRRSLPPSVRSLLTDIGPKEDEWAETEPEPVATDGILLPSRGAASEQEGVLRPAKSREETATDTKRSAVCMMCRCNPSCYTCPRCNLQYCGLGCYQSPQHSACSEDFYKESVLRELKEMGTTESEGRKKMQEILLRLRQKAESTDGGVEGVLKEVGVLGDATDEGEGRTTEKVQAVELLARLAELQQTGEGSTSEIECILRKLEEVGDGVSLPGDLDDDAEGAEGELDLADRLSGLDIDKLSEDELWELLNTEEKETFMGLMKGGALGGLVPLWEPWWEEHEEGGTTLVQVLEEEVGKLDIENKDVVNEQDGDNTITPTQEEGQKWTKSTTEMMNVKRRMKKETRTDAGGSSVHKVPPVSTKIPKLSSLCANASPLVCYGLVNALYAYAFALTLLNGDTDTLTLEFCEMVLALSEALNSNRVFNSVQDALDRGETLILSRGYFDKEDPLAPARAVEAVAHIMTGRNRQDPTGFSLAALSQLRTVLSVAKKRLPKDGDKGARRQKYFTASKKCEFFQAWVLDNVYQIRIMAVELWSEHSKRENTRNSVERAKTVVENLKKEKRKENDRKLIEELS